jgi:hypothetical protein
MRNPPSVLFAAAAVAALSTLAAGCGAGGGSSPGVATVGTSTTAATTTQNGLLAYSRCMRSHGVRNFPDPGGKGGIPKSQVVAASEADPQKFNAASAACSHLLPSGSLAAPQTAQQRHTQLEDELSFARCMRSHGVSRFPDPTAQGQLTVAMVQAQGIDVHSSTVLRVVQACLPASHGALTAAKVRDAIDNAGG